MNLQFIVLFLALGLSVGALSEETNPLHQGEKEGRTQQKKEQFDKNICGTAADEAGIFAEKKRGGTALYIGQTYVGCLRTVADGSMKVASPSGLTEKGCDADVNDPARHRAATEAMKSSIYMLPTQDGLFER